ncbi:MAG: tripartite tricarboxylate transporter substrate binding protein [Betaproteobacteria bacterium]|nr:tripartite tricarboxylate transporter substrate binding protein [Betaproteobacteria bacterium]
MKRSAIIVAVFAWLVSSGFPASWAAEDDYPVRPIQLIVPFAAGGSLDITARVVGQKLREYLGQQLVIVNRPGAGSAVGARFLASSPPDGYTIYLASGSTFGFLHLLVPGFPYQLKDFAPIAAIATNTSVFAVNAEVPVNSLPELVAYVQKNPGKLNFCTTGLGGLNHLQFEMFKTLVKEKHGGLQLDLPHVPYNGVAPALTALRGNQVQVCTLPYSSLLKNSDGKGIRMIAIMRPQRLASIAHVPACAEQGFAEMDGNNSMVNFTAPADTPAPILAKLETALQKTMQDNEVRQKLEDIDAAPTFLSAREMKEWLEGDVRKWEMIIRNANMVVK